jgi:branched-chain amino acid transport system permease protein
MIPAAVLVGILSLIISYLGFRSRMTVLTFGLFTLIWGAIGEFVLATIRPFGSTEVISNYYSGTNLLLYQFESPIAFYYIILLFCVGAILLSKYIINSKFGVYLAAIRGNERLAASVGINVMRYRTIAVVSSMMLWTFAGTFWAQYNRAASAELVAIEPLLFTILIVAFGGMGTLWGPILGAGILIPIREMLRIKFVTLPGLSIVLFGLIIAVILLILRDGIVPWYTEYVRKKRSMVKKIEAQV